MLKAGDKVRCVESSKYCSFSNVKAGNIYTVLQDSEGVGVFIKDFGDIPSLGNIFHVSLFEHIVNTKTEK